MATFSADGVDVRNFPPNSTIGGQEIVVRVEHQFDSVVTLDANDVIRMVKLPADYMFVSCELDTDALGTSAVASVGILNAAETAIAAAAITGQSIASAAIARDNSSAARRYVTDIDTDRMVGIVVTTAASAALTAGVKVGLTMRYRVKQMIEPQL